MEQNLEISAIRGLELGTTWGQSEPKDFSRPKIRWFSFGFDQVAYFVCPIVRRTDVPPAIRVRGQACNADTCSQLDVTLDFSKAAIQDGDTGELVRPELADIMSDLVPVLGASPTSTQSKQEAKK